MHLLAILLFRTTVHYVNPDMSIRSMEQLATIETPRLRTVHLTKYLVEARQSPLQLLPPMTRFFLELLRSHWESLVEVTIPVDVWQASDDIRKMTFPQLKSLTTIVTCDVTATFEIFLMNHHKTLEELDVYFAEDMRRFSDKHYYWQAIARCITSCTNLKKVHLKIPHIFWTLIQLPDLGWSFLEGMEHLTDFQVDVFRFGARSDDLTPDDASGLNAVDDKVLQFILKEMTSLEEFEVSHCSRLTDVGIAGTGPEEQQQGKERVSIRSVKGLSTSHSFLNRFQT